MKLFFPKTRWFSLSGLWQELWSVVWNLAEYTGTGLGRFAPWVFGQMMGCKAEKKDKKGDE